MPQKRNPQNPNQVPGRPVIKTGDNANIIVSYGNSRVNFRNEAAAVAQPSLTSHVRSQGEISRDSDEKAVSATDEDLKQFLLKAYTGVWGAKIFWLGIVTLLPVLLALKVHAIQLKLSFAALLYVFYHGIGIYIWMEVRQALNVYRATRNAWSRLYSIGRFHHIIGYIVAILLIVTFIARINVEFYGTHHLNLPEVIYQFLGVPKPDQNTINKNIFMYDAIHLPIDRGSDKHSESLDESKKTIPQLTSPVKDITNEVGEKVAQQSNMSNQHEPRAKTKRLYGASKEPSHRAPLEPIANTDVRPSLAQANEHLPSRSNWFSSLWKIRIGNAENPESYIQTPDQCPILPGVTVKQGLSGAIADKSSLVYDITIGNSTDSQVLLTQWKANWRYVRGQLTSGGGTGYLLAPIAEYILVFPVDPESAKVSKLEQPIYPSLVLPPGTMENPSLVTLRVQVHYNIIGPSSFHPNDWDIYFDLAIMDREKNCIIVFDNKEWLH